MKLFIETLINLFYFIINHITYEGVSLYDRQYIIISNYMKNLVTGFLALHGSKEVI